MNCSFKMIVFCVFILFMPASTFAQIEADENPENVAEIMKYNTPFSVMLENNGALEKLTTSNAVFIQQIGDANTVRSIINSENSEVRYAQNGDFNNIHSQVGAKKVNQLVLQQGNYNQATYLDAANLNPLNNPESSLQLQQTGTDNSFVSYDSNSISNDLQFRINGNSETIIVKNYQ